jgi:type IV pilus assembly protein PilC
MPKYSYVAKSLDGVQKTGEVEAGSSREVAKMLHQEGFVLIEAKCEDGVKKGFKILIPSFGVGVKEKIFFTKNLQVMIASGLSLPRSISILAEQAKNNNFKKALETIKTEITQGKNFSESMQEYPSIFSDFYSSMVKVGEETGTLEKVLDILDKQLEKDYDLQSKVKGALIYPAVIVVLMLGIGVLMLVYVVPTLSATFIELKVELPMTTQVVMGFGNFFKDNILAIIALTALFVFGVHQFFKTVFGKRLYDNLMLVMPIISPIVKNINSAYTVRNLSSLIASGVSLPRALEITGNTLGNHKYKNALIESEEKVKKGEKFSEALKKYDAIYPVTLIQMIAVGEETGETSVILSKLADFYENEVSEATKNLASVIEPFLMIIIGVVVGFFAVSMIQPMYSMMDSMN